MRAAKFAVAELQDHILKITGVKLPVLTDPENLSVTKIYIGESEFTQNMGLKSVDFANQHFLVRVHGDSIVLIGRDASDAGGNFDYANHSSFPNNYAEQGTVYAVYEFLDKIGVRWYLPGEIGTVYDTTKTVTVEDFEVRRCPFMDHRYTYTGERIPKDYAGSPYKGVSAERLDRRDVALWLHRMKEGGKQREIGHSLYGFFERFQKTHPEYFAKGYPVTKFSQLCYTNPELIGQIVKDAGEFLDGKENAWKNFFSKKQFQQDMVPIVAMDNRDWCQCANCLPLLQQHSGNFKPADFFTDTASVYWWTFINKVANEVKTNYPDAVLGVSAYGSFAYPPPFPLADNLLIKLCKQSPEFFTAWEKSGSQHPKTLHLYYCFPALHSVQQKFEFFPHFFASMLADSFQRYKAANVRGFFIEPSRRGNADRSILHEQLEIYLTYRLADNPSLDAAELINDFFARYYGKAGVAMKKLYQEIEKTSNLPLGELISESAEKGPEACSLEEEHWRYRGSPGRLAEWQKIMDDATKLAAQDREVCQKRVEIFERGIWKNMLAAQVEFQRKQKLMKPSYQSAVAPRVFNPEPGNPLTVDWSKTAKLSKFFGGHLAEKIHTPICGFIGNDGKYFYLRLEETIDATKLVDSSHPDFNGLELSFGLQPASPHYQINIANSGTFWHALQWDPIQGAGTWKPKIHVVSDRSSTQMWQFFFSIALDEIGANAPGKIFMNILRNRRPDPNDIKNVFKSCWIPTFAGHIAPYRMGPVTLE